jgi:hypothetical protein
MGTVFRYNLVHDNLAKGHTAGIYFDHCSHNAVVHHNVVWNVPGMPLQVNNPAYFMLCYNNTLWNGGRISTFDHSHRNDMFGCRFQNNICPGPLQLPEHVVTQPNLISENPGFLNPGEGRFELQANSAARGTGVHLPGISRDDGPPDLGALQVGWRAGHDFQNPPRVDTSVPEIAFSNALKNAAFELGSTEFWTVSGDGSSNMVTGNGWGNGFGQTEAVKTGTSKFELKLTGPCELQQAVTNLHAERRYQASAWIKLDDQNVPAVFGIRLPDGEEVTVTVRHTTWERALVDFELPRQASEVVLFVRQPAGGTASVDNFGLPRNIR